MPSAAFAAGGILHLHDAAAITARGCFTTWQTLTISLAGATSRLRSAHIYQ
jgi:hypothetical protein